MTRDDIIKLAAEAGIVVTGEAIWKLCELVAAAEREACAEVADYMSDFAVPHNAVAIAIRARGNNA